MRTPNKKLKCEYCEEEVVRKDKGAQRCQRDLAVDENAPTDQCPNYYHSRCKALFNVRQKMGQAQIDNYHAGEDEDDPTRNDPRWNEPNLCRSCFIPFYQDIKICTSDGCLDKSKCNTRCPGCFTPVHWDESCSTENKTTYVIHTHTHTHTHTHIYMYIDQTRT